MRTLYNHFFSVNLELQSKFQYVNYFKIKFSFKNAFISLTHLSDTSDTTNPFCLLQICIGDLLWPSLKLMNAALY